jgi:Acylphosphatases
MPTSNQPIAVRAHVFVSGRVQGVGYRYYTQKQARDLGIQGWVRNLTDGRVEAVFEGNPNTVDEMRNRVFARTYFTDMNLNSKTRFLLPGAKICPTTGFGDQF